MYFLVREPMKDKRFKSEGQGFATEIQFLSELIDGRVNIDGMKNIDVSMGDVFNVSLDPD